METAIELKGLSFYAYHGVMPQEKKVGNRFLVDLTFEVDVSKALYSDDLKDTINYAEVYDLVAKEMAIPSKLLEHIAGRVISSLHQSFPSIHRVKLKITKVNPPFKAQLEGVSLFVKETFDEE